MAAALFAAAPPDPVVTSHEIHQNPVLPLLKYPSVKRFVAVLSQLLTHSIVQSTMRGHIIGQMAGLTAAPFMQALSTLKATSIMHFGVSSQQP